MAADPNTEGTRSDEANGNPLRPRKVQVAIAEAWTLCQQAFRQAGYSDEQGAIITDHLVDAELRGHPFAGLARALSIIEQLQQSSISPNQEIEVKRAGPTFAQIDGHDSVGYLVARQATQMAIDRAKDAGISVVGANGLWYTGNLAYYAEMATREDLVVMIASNGSRIVAPHGGYEPKMCTNPFAIGFPTSDREQPVIWDIGTSRIMWAQIKLAERMGIPIPEGSAFNAHGEPTIDPREVIHGAMAVWGGHKGSGLAMMVQLLGIAAGSGEPTPFMSDFGFLVIAFDPSILTSLERVKQEADKFAESIRATKMLPGQGPARMPFDRSIESRRLVKDRGWFEVEHDVVDQLRSYGEKQS